MTRDPVLLQPRDLITALVLTRSLRRWTAARDSPNREHSPGSAGVSGSDGSGSDGSSGPPQASDYFFRRKHQLLFNQIVLFAVFFSTNHLCLYFVDFYFPRQLRSRIPLGASNDSTSGVLSGSVSVWRAPGLPWPPRPRSVTWRVGHGRL